MPDVGRTALYHHRGGRHGLQAAAAASVELNTRHFDRQPDTGRFAIGVRLRKHHVVNVRRVKPGSLEQRAHDARAERLDDDVVFGAASTRLHNTIIDLPAIPR
jgi:hypothetical protein